GVAAIEKSLVVCGLTTSVTLVECVADAPVPVMVIVYVPASVVALVATVKVELAPALTDVGLNVAVASAGRPDAVRLTDCALPEVTAVETVYMADPPTVTLADGGIAEIEKSLAVVDVHEGNVKLPMRVCQLNVPLVAWYSVVYQKVQSSVGS